MWKLISWNNRKMYKAFRSFILSSVMIRWWRCGIRRSYLQNKEGTGRCQLTSMERLPLTAVASRLSSKHFLQVKKKIVYLVAGFAVLCLLCITVGLSFVSFCYTNEILSMLCATYQNKLRIFVYCVYIVFPLCSASVYEISSSWPKWLPVALQMAVMVTKNNCQLLFTRGWPQNSLVWEVMVHFHY